VNFSRHTVESAKLFCKAIHGTLKNPDGLYARNVRLEARRRAATAGLDPDELNALARICGHPFAPDLPLWMLGLDVQLVAPYDGGLTARVGFGSRDYNRLTAEGWTQTPRK